MADDADTARSPTGDLKHAVEGPDTTLVDAIRYEHSLTFVDAVKLYPAAIGWSAFMSIGVIMLAFDPQLLGNFAATPQFQTDFGYEYEGSVRPHSFFSFFPCSSRARGQMADRATCLL